MWLRSLLAIAVFSGCSAIAIVNAGVPDGLDTGLSYGESERQRLDVYAPPDRDEVRPVVVFFYGGSWQGGNRRDYRFVGHALAEEGLVAVIPDYRVHPEVGFPDFVRDAARVVCWARRHVRAYGGDPERLFLMGHSAGAHIAALLAYDRRYLEETGLSTEVVSGFVGLAGPYDFLPLRDPVLKTVFGPVERWPESQPIRFADGGGPPALLVTGSLDWTVSPGNSRRLAARIREAGGQVDLVEVPWLGHRTIIASLARPLRWLAPVLREATRFVRGRASVASAAPAQDEASCGPGQGAGKNAPGPSTGRGQEHS